MTRTWIEREDRQTPVECLIAIAKNYQVRADEAKERAAKLRADLEECNDAVELFERKAGEYLRQAESQAPMSETDGAEGKPRHNRILVGDDGTITIGLMDSARRHCGLYLTLGDNGREMWLDGPHAVALWNSLRTINRNSTGQH